MEKIKVIVLESFSAELLYEDGVIPVEFPEVFKSGKLPNWAKYDEYPLWEFEQAFNRGDISDEQWICFVYAD